MSFKCIYIPSCSSFPVIHKVSNVDIFVLLKFESKSIATIIHMNFISEHHDKCKLSGKFIQFLTNPNLFPLEIVQKWQYCQLCVLRENSFGGDLFEYLVLSVVNGRLDNSK